MTPVIISLRSAEITQDPHWDHGVYDTEVEGEAFSLHVCGGVWKPRQPKEISVFF